MAVADLETNNSTTTIIEPLQIDGDDVQARELPRTDDGKDAWLVLAGCFMLEALVWGYLFPLRPIKMLNLDHADSKAVSRTHSVCSRITTRLMNPSTASRLVLQQSRQLRVESCSSLRR